MTSRRSLLDSVDAYNIKKYGHKSPGLEVKNEGVGMIIPTPMEPGKLTTSKYFDEVIKILGMAGSVGILDEHEIKKDKYLSHSVFGDEAMFKDAHEQTYAAGGVLSSTGQRAVDVLKTEAPIKRPETWGSW